MAYEWLTIRQKQHLKARQSRQIHVCLLWPVQAKNRYDVRLANRSSRWPPNGPGILFFAENQVVEEKYKIPPSLRQDGYVYVYSWGISARIAAKAQEKFLRFGSIKLCRVAMK